jgi:hypothetical protein
VGVNEATVPAPASPWAERLGDWAGPLVVKELRQGLASKAFAATFGLMLTAAFLVTATMGARALQASGPLGGWAFWLSCSVFAVYGQLFIPFLAYRALVREREEDTWLLLVLTGIGAEGIVRGKHLSAVLLLGLGLCATAPFMLFSYLLSGVALPSLGLALWWQLGVSFLLVTAAVGLAAQAHLRLERAGGHFIVVGLGVLLGGPSLAVTWAVTFEGEKFIAKGEVLGLLALLPVAMVLVAMCIPPAGAAALALPSESRPGPARRTVAGTFFLGVLTTSFLVVVLEAHPDFAVVLSVLNALALLAVGYFSISSRAAALHRTPRSFFDRPGALPSVVASFGLLAFSAAAFFATNELREGRHGAATVAGPAFVMLYLSLGVIVSRLTPLARLGPVQSARVGFVVTTTLGIAVPTGIAIVTGDRVDRGLGWVFNPLFGMARFIDRSGHEEEVVVLAGAAVLAALVALIVLAAEAQETTA